jgi:hypothetical protein
VSQKTELLITTNVSQTLNFLTSSETDGRRGFSCEALQHLNSQYHLTTNQQVIAEVYTHITISDTITMLKYEHFMTAQTLVLSTFQSTYSHTEKGSHV